MISYNNQPNYCGRDGGGIGRGRATVGERRGGGAFDRSGAGQVGRGENIQ